MSSTIHKSAGFASPGSPRPSKEASRPWLLAGILTGALLCGLLAPDQAGREAPSKTPELRLRNAHLNGLRDAVNARYGFLNGGPRINQGPCLPFAVAFQEAWNRRFAQPVSLLILSTREEDKAFHVMVELPDGSGFDGGRGVIPPSVMPLLVDGDRVTRMRTPDLGRLEALFGPLDRHYPRCPDYDHAATRLLIAACLDGLKRRLKAGS